MDKQSKGRGGDGVKKLGVRADGQLWWEARLVYVDPRTGKRRDTTAKFVANSKALAMKERARLIREAKEGTAAGKERRKWSEVSTEWIATLGHGTRVSWGSHVKKFDAAWGDWWIDKVTKVDVVRELEKYRYLSPGTWNHHRTVAMRVFDFAKERGWCEDNPAAAIRQRSEKRERAHAEALADPPPRSMSIDQMRAFLDDLRENDHPVYVFAYVQFSLGARFGEVSSLKHQDIDWSTGIVTIRRTQNTGVLGPAKGRYARQAALGANALELLKGHVATVRAEAWPGHETFVFPRPPTGRPGHSLMWSHSTVGKAYRRAFARLGFDIKTSTHVLRRAAIDALREVASHVLIRKIVGHSSETYTELYSSAQKQEILLLAERLGGIVGQEVGNGDPPKQD